IDVSLIAPGMVTTRFGHAAAERRDTEQVDPARDDFNERDAALTLSWDRAPQARTAWTPADVAERVLRAVEAKHPRARYRAARSATLMIGLRRVLSERALERVLRTQFPSPKPGA